MNDAMRYTTNYKTITHTEITHGVMLVITYGTMLIINDMIHHGLYFYITVNGESGRICGI